jgi:HlyD family secretion protein
MDNPIMGAAKDDRDSIVGGAHKIVNMGESVKPRGSKGKRRKTIAAILGMAAAAVALIAVFSQAGAKKSVTVKGYSVASVQKADFVKTADASGTVVLPNSVSVTSPQDGYAKTINVAEGDTVVKGQVVATLTVSDLVSSMEYYRALLAASKVAYNTLENDYDYSIAGLDNAIARDKQKVADQQKVVDTKKALLALQSSKQSDYDDAVDALTTLQNALQDDQLSRANQIRKRQLDLAKQQSTINEYQVQFNQTSAEVESARIKAPMSGEVLSIASKIQVPGSLIEQKDALMTIADRSSTYIDFQVDEQYVSALKLGDTLTATIGSSTVAARITHIGKTATLSSDGLTSTVTVRTQPTAKVSLTPGATATATVTLGTKQGALILPRGAYLTTGGQKYVYKVEGDKAVKTKVEFGDIQGTSVEVLSGLAAGDRIITSGYSDYIDNDAVTLGK